MRLVHAHVARLEHPLREVDDRRMHVEPVQRAAPHERELGAPPMLVGPEPRSVLGHLGPAPPQRRRVLAGRDVARGFVVEVLGPREHRPQIVERHVDGAGLEELVEQYPAVVLPRRHFVVAGQPSLRHDILPLRSK